jgi:hypothetical protein
LWAIQFDCLSTQSASGLRHIKLVEAHTGPACASHNNMDIRNLDIEAGFPVSKLLPEKGEIQAGIIPSGTYAIFRDHMIRLVQIMNP